MTRADAAPPEADPAFVAPSATAELRPAYQVQPIGWVRKAVHPDHSEVFPLAPEPILKQDGARKNDCERNVAKRLLADLRRAHPHLKLIVVEDGLASNAPHIRRLQALNLRFIFGAKQSDHTVLFDWVATTPETAEATFTDEQGFRHRFRYLNGAPLNDANFDLEVNFLAYWERAPDGAVTHFSWVTDIPIHEHNFMTLMRGARARWKVENETFNTLKNQGYHFEHNFGHGNNHLSTVFMHLTMLAFLIDQIQQRGCRLFQAALTAAQSKTRLWRKLRSRFDLCLIPAWTRSIAPLSNRRCSPCRMTPPSRRPGMRVLEPRSGTWTCCRCDFSRTVNALRATEVAPTLGMQSIDLIKL